MALPPPFATTAAAVSVVPSGDFASQFAKIRAVPELSNISVCLMDMTNQPKKVAGHSLTAGLDPDLTRYSGSVVKIAAMFAAFRLRKNFREAAAQAAASTVADLIVEVTDAWKPTVELAPGSKKDFPDLRKIFTITGSARNWTIDFNDTYYTRMKGMIGKSDNDDASYCILPLGYKYIQGALVAEGFYKGGGLWLGGDYAKGRDGDPEPTSKSHQAASAASAATMLSLLVMQSLVKDSASSQMRRMMYNCFTTRALHGATPARLTSPYSFGKLGIGVDGTRHDAAVIERTIKNGTTVRYVSVILGAPRYDSLRRVALFLDDVVEWWHT
jgi:hypothetical protein